ncbi:Transcriptional regulator [Apiospora kogelbergensis]|uniref:Transcriptional regulator n=1 Tax=Apiospora kogelbergensis TaxID=1337665 RepID=UPI00312D3819
MGTPEGIWGSPNQSLPRHLRRHPAGQLSMVRTRFTLLCQFPEHSNTKDRGGDMKKSSACISAVGTVAKKAYGTLNHLNAHVTMQSHGQKRTPEEFKEIRKEWKQRKKDEEQQRKAAEEAERQRQSNHPAQVQNGAAGPEGADGAQPPQPYSAGRSVHLPPIGYTPQYPAPPSAGVTNVPEYSPTNIAYPNYQQPASPYAPPNPQMYSQRP